MHVLAVLLILTAVFELYSGMTLKLPENIVIANNLNDYSAESMAKAACLLKGFVDLLSGIFILTVVI